MKKETDYILSSIALAKDGRTQHSATGNLLNGDLNAFEAGIYLLE